MQRRLVKCLEDLCCHYDMTIRTSTNDIVQFAYGGDSLDPTFLEGKDKPIDYERIYEHVRAKYRCDNEDPLNGYEMNNFICQQLQQDEYSIMEQEYKQQIVDFIHNMSLKIDRIQTKYCVDTSMYNNQISEDNKQELKSLTNQKRVSITTINCPNKRQRTIPNVLYEIERCTKLQLVEFLRLCKYKYGRARLEPGTAVGALCAQSIGEPATQMTLKSLY